MYATVNPYQRYKQQGVLTANPVELIVMLYDGCIKQVKIGAMAIADAKADAANTALQKAQNILLELIKSLDLSYEISNELMSLYEFMINEIARANLAKDAQPLEGVMELLGTLRQAWSEIAKEGRGAVVLEES